MRKIFSSLLLTLCFFATGTWADDYVLALTWQPTFCEIRPTKSEFRTQTRNRYDAKHLALHGLWPQPRGRDYCGVSKKLQALDKTGDWARLPEPQLNTIHPNRLEQLMPGARSHLHRHEWIKHGTCYGRNAEAYFRDSFRLLLAVNDSLMGGLFQIHRGKFLSAKAIRGAFDGSFGYGAGDRVEIKCHRDGNRQLIFELRLHLSGDPSRHSIKQLLHAARPVRAGCKGGIVDPVGNQ